jgi:RND family efflux transporter MFP subunit
MPPPVAVSVVEVRAIDLPVTYDAPGTVRAATVTTLASRVMGYVREVKVQTGDRVSAGQLLVRIDSRDLESGLLQAQAAEQEARSGIAEAENGIAAAKAQLGLAEVTFRRMADLFAKKSISNQEFDEAQARLRAAEAAYQMAVSKRTQLHAKIAQAAQGVESASVMRSYAEIHAPFAGVVTEKRVEQGQLATPGTPLVTIEQAGAYRLEAAVQERMLGSVRPGQSVSVLLDTWNQPLNARVTEVVPAVDPASRTFLVKATLPAGPMLRSGLFGRLRLQRGVHQAIAIPANAIVNRGALQSVFVADNGVARLRMVTAGQIHNGQAEILSGLHAGDSVIHSLPLNLADGMRVEVRK